MLYITKLVAVCLCTGFVASTATIISQYNSTFQDLNTTVYTYNVTANLTQFRECVTALDVAPPEFFTYHEPQRIAVLYDNFSNIDVIEQCASEQDLLSFLYYTSNLENSGFDFNPIYQDTITWISDEEIVNESSSSKARAGSYEYYAFDGNKKCSGAASRSGKLSLGGCYKLRTVSVSGVQIPQIL